MHCLERTAVLFTVQYREYRFLDDNNNTFCSTMLSDAAERSGFKSNKRPAPPLPPPRRSPFRGGPAIAIGLATGSAIGAIVYSHYAQVRDKAEMRAGVERDKERLRMRKKRLQQEAAEKHQSP
jgi:hypothetical protein